MSRRPAIPLLSLALGALLAILLARSAIHSTAHGPATGRSVSSTAHLAYATNARVGSSVATEPPSIADGSTECVVEGTVLSPDGVPCAADVFASERSVPSTSPQVVRSAADGRYKFLLRGYAWNVCAVQGTDISDAKVVEDGEDDQHNVVLRLKPGAVVSGRVTDSQDIPIAGALVACLEDSGNDLLSQATTEASGEYRMTVPPTDLLFVAQSEGYGPAMQHTSVWPGQEARVDLRLAPVLTLSGRVVDSGGLPIHGCKVIANLSDDESPERLLGKTQAVTDGDGRYEIGPLADREYDLRLMADGYANDYVVEGIRLSTGKRCIIADTRPDAAEFAHELLPRRVRARRRCA